MTGQLPRGRAFLCAVLSALALASCSGGSPLSGVSDLFETKKTPLPGERVAILGTDTTATASIESKEPIKLPAPQENASWSQPGGVPSNAPGHLAYAGAAQQIWKEDAGSGSNSDGKVVALPIVYGGKVFTLDREGRVSAFSLNGGRVWRTELAPKDEKSESGYGGGLAADGNRLYVATGFGTLVALDIGNGNPIWTKALGVPIRTSPTAANGKIFVVNTDSELFALSGENGSELWRNRGLPEGASVLSNVSPAVSGNTLVVAYTSGDIVALDIATGQQRWNDSTTGGLTGVSITSIGDAARPVIDGGVVYAGSRTGRLVATGLTKGERVWSLDIRAAQTPWVAGDAVFVVDTTGKLYALNRKNGKTRWVSTLPGAKTWSGPTLAGGKLWLISNKGLVVGVDATTGQVATQRDLDTPVYISPVIANNRMFVLTDKANLIAMN